MTALSNAQKRYLKGLAHHLKPVVMLGDKGLTPAVIAEVERGLDDHELIKVKLNGADRQQRSRDLADISAATGAWAVQRIGHVGVFYRPNPEQPRIRLPD